MFFDHNARNFVKKIWRARTRNAASFDLLFVKKNIKQTREKFRKEKINTSTNYYYIKINAKENFQLSSLYLNQIKHNGNKTQLRILQRSCKLCVFFGWYWLGVRKKFLHYSDPD